MEITTINPPPSEAKASTPRSETKSKPPAKQSLHYRLVITLYRLFAITVLYLVLAGIFAYAFVMGFYAVNNSWAAPIILSAADEKSLDFRQKIVYQPAVALSHDPARIPDPVQEIPTVPKSP